MCYITASATTLCLGLIRIFYRYHQLCQCMAYFCVVTLFSKCISMSGSLASKGLTHKRTFDLNLLRVPYEASRRSSRMLFLDVHFGVQTTAAESPMCGFV